MPLEHLADGPKPFTLLGENIVLWLDRDGNPAALQDRCCHRTAKLSKGFCEDGNIVCGYHGWTYDRTGKCVRIPQYDPGTQIPVGCAGQATVAKGATATPGSRSTNRFSRSPSSTEAPIRRSAASRSSTRCGAATACG